MTNKKPAEYLHLSGPDLKGLCCGLVTHPHRRAKRVLRMVRMTASRHNEEVDYGKAVSPVNGDMRGCR
jgi:hypothetical protein